ncbi:hypothetical protein COT48_04410 [Candidatus Woesearchaeota archaeon CG08_land_8_20_14_0_20_47_9]|nr:MAG: hypothetical protein AUJ69_03695 [Candidatus Woesearchaeota archaeon CG1_02_47_18]PIO03551.1 MAG: hypothetical protein COT48_04410 [Candidatus Woesearchaeota archaeon CG08_land_8_20_14_0_20_47_9]HII29547.1 type II secretion system F family protein [Candidatus Woesearchaeota archaeon]
MPEGSYDFVKNTFRLALMLTLAFALILFAIFSAFKMSLVSLALLLPLLLIIFFFYFMRLPDVHILKLKRNIDKEIVFAGRFLVVEIESGVPLYNAMQNISKNYETIGRYFREVIDLVDVGTSMEEAINEVIEFSPSDNLRRLLWQILNPLTTGADVSDSISSIIDQMTREQLIEVNEYGKKLSPLAMFYMIIAVILPSIGVIMLIIMATFISIKLDIWLLSVIALLLAFMQFMFLSMIKSQRPAVEL